MIKINVKDDFSKTPGGRLKSEGPDSGEEFREKLLLPKYKKALNQGEKLQIDLDGCYGFTTSFLEEAFGGLARKLENKKILEIIEIVSDDEPALIEDIKGYVKKTKLK